MILSDKHFMCVVIRPKTPPVPIAPPPEFAGPITTWPTPADLLAARLMPPYPTPPPHLIPSWMSDYPHHQTPNPPQLVTNFFPPSSFAPPPSNLTTPPAIRPVTASVRGYRSQSTATQKSGTISPPFPWATNYRGQIQCRHCETIG
ncbi:hypothetical protein ISN45_Aa04g017930 [Arabidopsis thaliana x Arabidopsis arenosa]|uniref:Uncharacterized protein n=1 Tax=Arabidopsis thaliana x Arabidopsis arenosa TaxID=1240361 RepID=A0A8T2AAK3_9BRAS|nr:hypothetical protein ISN45_Aa04g017930 [Arabidopsis thaliana x Arabidopsis arenosa]